ncbi:cyclodeaminase/cyclohydrolase family protein [Pelotomaculum propionicicum]|uniref:cyclodeaminase/cyclohydrolase family protein n=1 Tax=Pelotomaculum propionicicum TaxID=258475 RepID=UPI003B7AF969
MSTLYDKSLREVIELSSSKSPTPGGGSISAIAAVLGLSMAAMVCNLTIGKEKYKDVEPEVKNFLDAAEKLIDRLVELTEDDIKVFNRLMSAYRMPRASEEEKEAREAAVQKALKDATEVPMEIARVCLQALQASCRLSEIGNKAAVSDAGVAAVMAEAALNGALLNVDINTPTIKDREYIDRILAEKEKMLAEAGELRGQALAAVRQRIKG